MYWYQKDLFKFGCSAHNSRMNFLMLVVLPVSIYVLAVIVLLGLDDRLLSLWRSWSGSVKRLILSMFLLFAFPLLAGTTGGVDSK